MSSARSLRAGFTRSERLNDIGFERTRRALAGLGLSAFVTLYLLVALSAPEGLGPVLVALAACYAVAFVAVVAEWFWGRWFATGLAWSGVMVAIASLAIVGWVPVLAIMGGLHAPGGGRPGGQEDGGAVRPAGGVAAALPDGRVRRGPAAQDRHPRGGLAARA